MSYRVFFEDAHGAVRCEFYGSVTVDEIPKAVLEAILLGQEASSLKRIYDIREMVDALQTITELFREYDVTRFSFMDNTRVAVIMPKELIEDKALSALFGPFIGNSSLNYCFFHDEGEALVWLRGLRPNPANNLSL